MLTDLTTVANLQIEDQLDEEYGPVNKCPRIEPPSHMQWGTGTSASQLDYMYQCEVMMQLSPLNLKMKKSPSLLELLEHIFSSQAYNNAQSSINTRKYPEPVRNKVGQITDKQKASNFPASCLRIGSWERVSSREGGDLIAKCDYAKRKLVWEVLDLDDGLKSKIEIQWEDITVIKATCPKTGHGTLDVVLSRPPAFYKEISTQKRKHTVWHVTEDFTGGEAVKHRRHILQCSQGVLNKHFERLIQCNEFLKWLSQQPEIILKSPYFKDWGSTKFHGFKFHGFDNEMENYEREVMDPSSMNPSLVASDAPSPDSEIEENSDDAQRVDIESLSERLLKDTDEASHPYHDERLIKLRVDSLECLLGLCNNKGENTTNSTQGPPESPEESIVEMLIGLPRVASDPKFICIGDNYWYQ